MLWYRWHRNTITDGDGWHLGTRRVAPGRKAGNDGGTTVALPAREGFHSALTPNKSVARMRFRKAFHDNFFRRSATVVLSTTGKKQKWQIRYLVQGSTIARLWLSS